MKKTAILSVILAASLALAGCAKKPQESGNSTTVPEAAPEVTESAAEATTAATTAESVSPAGAAAEITAAPETNATTEEILSPDESSEETSEILNREEFQTAELIGLTIGDIEDMFNTELAPSETGYLGSHTFDCLGAELTFRPLAETLADNYRDSVVTGIFISEPVPILDGITGQMSYDQLSEFIADPDAFAPEPNMIDGTTSTMFSYHGYRFMVMWTDYTDSSSPCYSITVLAE